MQLIMAAPSPFARKVRILARELNLMDQVDEVEIATTPLASDPSAVAANPLGKIPALIRPDGPAIYDSRVICRYLDDLADGSMYGDGDPWDMLTLEATIDGIMEACVLMTYEARFKGTEGAQGEWIEAQWQKADRGLASIQDRWGDALSGAINIGQIGLAAALGYMDLRHDARNWRANHPEIAAWEAGFAGRASVQETRPE